MLIDKLKTQTLQQPRDREAKMSKNIKIYKVGKNIATNKKRTQ